MQRAWRTDGTDAYMTPRQQSSRMSVVVAAAASEVGS